MVGRAAKQSRRGRAAILIFEHRKSHSANVILTLAGWSG